jgi:hypothetical protein
MCETACHKIAPIIKTELKAQTIAKRNKIQTTDQIKISGVRRIEGGKCVECQIPNPK